MGPVVETVRYGLPGPAASCGPMVTIGGKEAPGLRLDTIDYAHVPVQTILRPAGVSDAA